MINVISENTCRICLSDDAVLPIFDENKEFTKDIKTLLSSCLNEEVEDINGFPRNVCQTCNNTLEMVCNFINNYRESQKIISNILNIKTENTPFLNQDFKESDIDVKIEAVEEVNDWDGDDILISKIKSLNDDIQIKKIRTKNSLSEKKPIILNKQRKTVISKQKGDVFQNAKKTSLSGDKKKKDLKLKKNNSVVNAKKLINKSSNNCERPGAILCDICGATFKNSNKLNGHLARHAEKNTVSCSQCSFATNCDVNLRRHIRVNHGPKKYTCQKCGKKFCHLPTLNHHIKHVHDKITKIHSCAICNKTYKSPMGLVVHTRSAHTGERPEVCSICNASFFSKNYLAEHMRLHTGETPFKCPICDRGYPQKYNMWSHVKHNHKLSQLTDEEKSNLKPSILKRLQP